MKKMIFFIPILLLNFSLFAQSPETTIASIDNKNPKESYLTNYSLETTEEEAPNNFTKIQGDYFGNGLFIDFVIGGGNSSTSTYGTPNPTRFGGASVFGTSIRIGSKWYLGEFGKFKTGIQATWARIGVVKEIAPLYVFGYNPGPTGTTLSFSPVNVGSTNL